MSSVTEPKTHGSAGSARSDNAQPAGAIAYTKTIGRFLRGYATYLRTGETLPEAYLDLRRLSSMSGGRFHEIATTLASVCRPRCRLQETAGVLGGLSEQSVIRVVDELMQRGVHRFEDRLPTRVAHRLRRLAEMAPCLPEPSTSGNRRPARYDRRRWTASRYMVDPQVLHEHTDIQSLATDGSILNLAQSYLRCQPALVGCSLYWRTALQQQREPSERFRCDRGQFRSLNLIMYLSDVDEQRGPLLYVAGSHRRQPPALREDRWYTRDELADHVDNQDIKTLVGPAGTIYAVDAGGFHHEQPLVSRDRLTLELRFTASRFGEASRTITVNDRFGERFRDMCDRYPFTYSQFRIDH